MTPALAAIVAPYASRCWLAHWHIERLCADVTKDADEDSELAIHVRDHQLGRADRRGPSARVGVMSGSLGPRS